MWRLVPLLLLCGCGVKPGEQLDSLFESARDNLHAGELTKGLEEADRGLQLAVRRRDTVYQWKFRLLRCDILVMSTRPEEVLAQLTEPIPGGPQFAALSARKTMLEGQAQSMLSHSAEAEALLERAHQAAEAIGAEDVLLDIEILQGPVRGKLYGAAEAERVLLRAQSRAQALRLPFSQANVLMNLGVMRMRRHRYDEAAALLEQAAQVASPKWRVFYSVLQNNLAICYLNLGEHDRAIAIQLDAVERHRRTGAKAYLLGALGSVGESYLAKGELRQAIPHLKEALNLASELSHIPDAAISATNLANVYIELHDWTNAQVLNQEAIRLKTSVKDASLYYNVLNSAEIASGQGQQEEAARLYATVLGEGKEDPGVLWSAHEGLGVMAARRRDFAGAAREFEAAVHVLEKTRADLSRTEFKLPFLTRRIRLYQEYVDALIGQGQIDRALAVADSSRAQVLVERSGSTPIRALPAGAFAGLARASGSVLLSYWLAPEQSHAWVVTPRQTYHVALAGSQEIETHVAAFREAIERQLADPMRTPLSAGEKLYGLLIAPVRAYIPAGARVVVVPDGVLHAINLEALPVPGEGPRYWIQDVTLQIAPSLAMCGGPGAPSQKRRLLLLGDPVTNDATFPPLAHAAREISCVRQNFTPADQVVLTRESASPQAYLAAASGPFAAIHFTAHAIANRENPLESAVLLSGGKLYARDVMDVKLDTGLVTVSACRGAGLRTYSGEGLVGFAWAFLRAGARQVIAGLWDVNDQSTAGLMDVLYRELAAGKRPADALRAAKLAMIESRGNLRKPYYWAPFQLYTVAP